jgi:hypothetical protein
VLSSGSIENPNASSSRRPPPYGRSAFRQQLHDVEAIERHLRIREVVADAGDEGVGHVRAGPCDQLGVATVGYQISRKCLDGAGITAFARKQHPAQQQIHEDRAVVLALCRRRLIQADFANLSEVQLGSLSGHVGLDHPPDTGVVFPGIRLGSSPRAPLRSVSSQETDLL